MHAILPTDVRKKRRWLPRFGLRTLIAGIACACILLGITTAWYRSHKQEHDRQLTIAEKLKLAGAEIQWRSSAPDWIIESEFYGEHPSINQMSVLRVLEFIEEVNCLPGADLKQVFELLHELPRASVLSINALDFDLDVIDRIAELAHLQTLHVDYFGHKNWIYDPRSEQLTTQLGARLPGVTIANVLMFHHESIGSNSHIPTKQ